MLSQKTLKQILHYSPKTGDFTWLVSSGKARKGKIAGCLDNYGYLVISANGKAYKAHRLAFLYMTGSFPDDMVDHINRDKSDNRWLNLRESDNTANQRNTNLAVTNTSGYTGVSWNKTARKWQARINNHNAQRESLGLFADIKEAAAARRKAEIKYGYRI